MGDRDRERERSAEPRAADFKTFVGGISWQTTDQELSDSTCCITSLSAANVSAGSNLCNLLALPADPYLSPAADPRSWTKRRWCTRTTTRIVIMMSIYRKTGFLLEA